MALISWIVPGSGYYECRTLLAVHCPPGFLFLFSFGIERVAYIRNDGQWRGKMEWILPLFQWKHEIMHIGKRDRREEKIRLIFE